MSVEIPKVVKWAGGKVQLLEQFESLYPKSFNRYFEPFVGSAAVFFYIVQIYKPQEVMLSDLNEGLITLYRVIKEKPEELIDYLKKHKDEYLKDPEPYYYSVRASEGNTDIERAARFVFLNKTCFNGLYRENSKGKFNVPIGRYKNPDIIQEDKIRKASNLLQNVKLEVMSFEKIVDYAQKGDFVYFDPPYYPLETPNKCNKSFTGYTARGFLEPEQEKLRDVMKTLHEKGCYVMQSNSDTEYIKSLYSDDIFRIKFVKATRLINRNSAGRGKISEVVITNYD